MTFDVNKISLIKESLGRVGALKPCSRCGSEKFDILDQYFNLPISEKIHNLDKAVPMIGIMCSNCGNFNFHAAGKILASHEL